MADERVVAQYSVANSAKNGWRPQLARANPIVPAELTDTNTSWTAATAATLDARAVIVRVTNRGTLDQMYRIAASTPGGSDVGDVILAGTSEVFEVKDMTGQVWMKSLA